MKKVLEGGGIVSEYVHQNFPHNFVIRVHSWLISLDFYLKFGIIPILHSVECKEFRPLGTSFAQQGTSSGQQAQVK